MFLGKFYEPHRCLKNCVKFFFTIWVDTCITKWKIMQHEKHGKKKDPEHAHKHKIEEGIGAAVGLGAGGYGLHEHHEKKEDKKEAKEAKKEAKSHEKKHHNLF